MRLKNKCHQIGMSMAYGSVLVVIDQLTKVIGDRQGWVVMNYGGVFGVGQFGAWVMVMVPIWAMLVGMWWRHKERGWWWWGLIVAGGLSNIIDRVWLGGVRDFIYYPVVEVYGNVADIYLLGGVIGLIVQERKK